MAVLGTLREKAGPILVGVIGIALLSFVVGDMFGGNGSIFSSGNNVGEINGEKISYEEYDEMINYYTSVYQAMYGQNASNEAFSEEIRAQAWQALVNKYVYNTQYDGFGLEISEDELSDMLWGSNPSPLVVRNFSNPQTGEFDRGMVLRYWQSMEQSEELKTFCLSIEKEVKNQRLATKLTNLVAKATYVTSADAKNMLDNTRNSVSMEYVGKSLNAVADSAVKVTSGDIKKYYNDHKQQYKQTASRDVEFVTFAIAPSTEDDQAAKEWIDKLAPDFKAAADVRQFTTLNSDVPFDATYHKKGDLPELFDNFAFSANKADMLEPMLNDNFYVMARLADVRMMPDSVRASHILLDGSRGMEATRKLADSIRTAIMRGANFADLAAKYSIDNVANEKGGDIGWFAQNAMVKPFGDSCFFAPKNRVMVVETQFGTHVVQVTDKGKEEKKVQLAVIQREVAPSRTTRTRIFSSANDLASQANDVASFEAKAAEKGYAVKSAQRVTINDRNVQGLEQARDLVRWAYGSKKGAVSGVFEISNNFVVAVLTEVREKGYAPVAQVSAEITAELLREKKAAKIAEEMKGATDLNSLAQQLNTNVGSVDDVNFASFYLTGLGMEPKVAAAASAAKENQLTGPISGTSGVYTVLVNSRNADAADAGQVAQEKIRLQAAVPMRINYDLFQTLYTEGEVDDQRGKFF